MSDSLDFASDPSGLVVFSENDPEDAKNWSPLKKRLVVLQVCLLSLAAGLGSPLYAATELTIIDRFGVNDLTADSGLTVYVLGFALGPLLCPLSELRGRRLPFLISWPLLIIFCAPPAFVNNITVILVFRFLAGCAAAGPLINGTGVIPDIYGANELRSQSTALAWFAFAFTASPCIALPIGFFIAADAGPQLWVLRVYFFLTVAMLPLVILLPETHGPTVLTQRARRLRKQGVTNAYAEHEKQHGGIWQYWTTHLGRPTTMLLREPLVQGSALWVGLAYGISYLFFEVYPIVYFNQHHFSLQLTGLPFLGLNIGFFFGTITAAPLVKLCASVKFPFIEPPGFSPTSPEVRMKVAILCCFLMPVSLFWFAWTSGEETFWAVSAASGIFFGYAVILILLMFLTYTSQTYAIYANSANSANAFFRALVAAGLVQASHKLIASLGTKWGVSLFGFLSLGLLPIPLIFLRYGEKLRGQSPIAREAAAVVARMRSQQLAALSEVQTVTALSTVSKEGEKEKGEGEVEEKGQDEESKVVAV